MKNLQEIINEMNNLSEQIAVTLNEEEIKEQEIKEEEQPVESISVLTNGSVNSCTDSTNRTVNFCCTVNFPANFTPDSISTLKANPRIIFDLSCLKCVVEECCTLATVGIPNSKTPQTREVLIPGYKVRIVGCIPFIVNLAVENNIADKICAYPSLGPLQPTVYACCHDSVCVDNVICTKCTKSLADAACRAIEAKLTCSHVDVSLNATDINSDGCIAKKVYGTFTLPDCPSI